MTPKIPLKELCITEITDGTHKTPQYSESGYIFLSSKNVTHEKIDWDHVMYIPKELHEELYRRIAPRRNDILLAKNGTTGVAAIVDRDEIFDIYVSLALIRPNAEIVLPRYLLYAINSEASRRYFNSNLKGIGVPNLHLTHIRETPIAVPDLCAQQKIVNRLDKVSDLIAKRRQQLDKLDLLVKSKFVEMFGDPVRNPFEWKMVGLLELGDCKNGMNFHTDDSGIEIHCLGVGDFKNLSYITDVSKLATVSLNEMPSSEYMLNDEDIVFVRSNGNKALVGRSLVVYPGDIATTFSGFCIRFRLRSDSMKIAYLLQALKTDSIRKRMTGRGANIQNLNQKILGELQIPVPPIKMQNQFAAFVEQTEKTKTSISQSLEKLETLKKALMQEYFG